MRRVFAAAVAGSWLASAWLIACASDDPASDDSAQAGAGVNAAGAGSGGSVASSAGSSGATSNPGSAAGSGGSASSAGSGGSSSAGSGGRDAGQAGSGGAGSSGSGSGGSAAVDAGTAGSSGAGGSGTGGSAGTADSSAGTGGSAATSEHFSFFVTSLAGMRRLSGSDDGFGGDLRHGEATGLAGADKICTELAEASLPGAGAKTWHAFLSAARGPDGKQVNAITRIGSGPWYDRLGRLLAMTTQDLQQTRPRGADNEIINDLPNEDGVPNHAPDPSAGPVDNHHVLTGSNEKGEFNGATSTCGDWQSTDKASGRPRVGFAWPAGGRENWISGQDEGGCGAGVSVMENGGSNPDNPIVGSGGGYGSIYCFALTP